MIILENVEGALWGLIRAIWESDWDYIQAWAEFVEGGEDAGRNILGHGKHGVLSDLTESRHQIYYIPHSQTRHYIYTISVLLSGLAQRGS